MDTEKILVSVIIPCYNQGQYLEEAVNSILSQTHKNVEILIINDGSTDKATLEVLNLYDHPLIRVYHKENGHLSSARNFGFRKASSEYVLTLDADDKFHPEFIERTLPVLLNDQNVAVASSWAKHFGRKNNIKYLYGGGLEDFLTENNCTACALIRKSVWEEVGGYDEKLRGFMDWEFYINVTKRGYRINVIREPLFFYRSSGTSMISGSIQHKPELFEYIYFKHRDVYSRFAPEVLYRKELEIRKIRDAFITSSSYRLGSILLWPWIRIKRFIQNAG